MSRLSAVAALLMLGAVPLSTSASAEMDHHPMHYHSMTHHHHRTHNRMHANGMCNGRSHGTGYNGCGTATGGPVGGLPSRN